MQSNYQTRLVFITSIFLFLCGCTVLTPINTPNDNIYVLNNIPKVEQDIASQPHILLVTPTQANPILNTNEMAYTTKPYQISFFAFNHWADTPSKMLEAALIETLQNTHHFRAVVSSPFVGQYQYVLNTQLLDLQQDFQHKPSIIHFTLRMQLLNAHTNQTLVSKEISFDEPTSHDTPYGGVLASNQVLAKALAKIAELCMV
jgi:cholesterol transport system auxiliary component